MRKTILSLCCLALAVSFAACSKPAAKHKTGKTIAVVQTSRAASFSYEFTGFRYKSWDLGPIQPQLKASAAQIQASLRSVASNDKITVYGHADKSGPENALGKKPGNVALSEKRAQAAADYLSKTFNIKASRFTVIGKGSQDLKDPSRPRDKVNRRIEIVYP